MEVMHLAGVMGPGRGSGWCRVSRHFFLKSPSACNGYCPQCYLVIYSVSKSTLYCPLPRFPTDEALDQARAGEIFERALELVKRLVESGSRFNLTSKGRRMAVWERPRLSAIRLIEIRLNTGY